MAIGTISFTHLHVRRATPHVGPQQARVGWSNETRNTHPLALFYRASRAVVADERGLNTNGKTKRRVWLILLISLFR